MARRNIGQTTHLLWLWMWMKKRRAAAAGGDEGGDGTQLDFEFADNSMHIMTVL